MFINKILKNISMLLMKFQILKKIKILKNLQKIIFRIIFKLIQIHKKEELVELKELRIIEVKNLEIHLILLLIILKNIPKNMNHNLTFHKEHKIFPKIHIIVL